MKISFASCDRINMQNNALIWKYVFQYKSGAFKDFWKIFYGNVGLNDRIQFSEVKEKTVFSASEGGK